MKSLLKYIFKNTEKNLIPNPPEHALLNQLLIKQLNQPYYLVNSTKPCVFD